MISPEIKLSCHLDRMPGLSQEQQRLHMLEELGLLETESIPIFEEATQTAAHFLDAPICILGTLDRDRLYLKSAVGLFRIGLMNDIASSRQLPRAESFCTHVVESQNILMIPDTTANPIFAETILVKRYGIHAYLGVPLIASNGQCLGTLAVMGLAPRNFTSKDAETLQLIARWSISEFERDRLLKQPQPVQVPQALPINNDQSGPASPPTPIPSVKAQLMSQMTQELCTPLTSILGMARVLSQGIYGGLTEKQKEYIEIIHNSGQYLLSLINEVIELGTLDDSNDSLNLNPLDIEMLCQQVINTLVQAAQRQEQEIRLTVEPGPRIWMIDKEKVRQMLYHLIFSMMQSSDPESIIRIHISRRQNFLNILIWISHPWLGEGLPQMEFTSSVGVSQYDLDDDDYHSATTELNSSRREVTEQQPIVNHPKLENDRQSLGLLLSRQLAELHGGTLVMQGSLEEGYRYVIRLPQLSAIEMRE